MSTALAEQEQGEWVLTKQAMKILKVDRRTIYRLIRERKLTAFQIPGAHRRIELASVMRFRDKHLVIADTDTN